MSQRGFCLCNLNGQFDTPKTPPSQPCWPACWRRAVLDGHVGAALDDDARGVLPRVSRLAGRLALRASGWVRALRALARPRAACASYRNRNARAYASKTPKRDESGVDTRGMERCALVLCTVPGLVPWSRKSR